MKKIVYSIVMISMVQSGILCMDLAMYKNLTTEDENGFFPLSLIKDQKSCEACLKYGANPNQVNKYGNTPFGHIVMNASTGSDLVELLLQNKANPDTLFDGQPVLHHAIQLGFTDKMRVLLEAGAQFSSDTYSLVQESNNAKIIFCLESFAHVMYFVEESMRNNNNQEVKNMLLEHPWVMKVYLKNNDLARICKLLQCGVPVPDYMVNKLGQSDAGIDYRMAMVLQFYAYKNS